MTNESARVPGLEHSAGPQPHPLTPIGVHMLESEAEVVSGSDRNDVQGDHL